MSQNIEVSDSVYQRLVQAAQALGTTPAAWIANQLPGNGENHGRKSSPTEDQIRLANDRLAKHIVSCDEAVGSENEAIDADLARDYGDDHADLYRPLRGK